MFSWEKPIEQEILAFVRHMKQSWIRHIVSARDRRQRREAQIYARAYETVERHILDEIELRKEVKDGQS